MRSYWFYLSVLGIAYLSGMVHTAGNSDGLPLRLIGSAFFFALFFLAPLFRERPLVYTINLSAASILAVLSLWPAEAANPYALLTFTIIAGKAVYRLPFRYAAVIGGILLMGALLPWFAGDPGFPPGFILLYAVLLTAAAVFFKKSHTAVEETEARNEALLSELRKMKRELVTGEQLARQEERTQIARDIHDSVGHKLTALLMQLEVSRMQTDGETAEQLQELKRLAKESLDETRNAVKTLRQDEGGLTAIIALIRKLEAESFLRIQFSVKHGALSAPLGNDQMVIVYRAVQEALTNIMRHSSAREAEIIFEAPGGGVFRFEVWNPAPEAGPFREGFGLSAMRERIEQAGGRFEAGQKGDRFVVQGSLPLVQKERS